jgi:hypothetical protein
MVVGFQVDKFVPRVQEVEEVREAHKAAASAQMAGIAEMAQSAEIGTLAKKNSEKTRWHKKRRYLLPGSSQGPRQRDNITLPTPHMPGSFRSVVLDSVLNGPAGSWQ